MRVFVETSRVLGSRLRSALSAAVVLAFVLGRMAEESIRQSLLMSRGSFDILLMRPLATTFIGLALAVMVLPAVLPSARAVVRMVGRETAE